MAEETVNRELNELVDREALSTHARTLVFLFILIYVVFVVLSTVFPCVFVSELNERECDKAISASDL